MNNNIIKMIKQVFSRALFLLAVLIVLLSGCEKIVTNVKLPEMPAKLVVGCFISPQDDSLVVTLSRSNPLFGAGHNNDNNLSVADAVVTISDGTNSATVPYNSMKEQYELQASLFPIASGQTYFLTVSTPQGESVSATCIVPSSSITLLNVDFIDTASAVKKINVKWQDTPNQTNYYRVFGQIVIKDDWSWIPDTSYIDMYNPDNSSTENDVEKDGQEIFSKLEGYQTSSSSSMKIIGYDIYLLTIDAGYYKYQYSLDHRGYDDPFSEPSLIYTNVEGGLGIFAAYQKFYIRK